MVGDKIELRGLIGGYFVWDVADGGPLFLVGGGSALCLWYRCCVIAARKRRVPTLLLLSARTWVDIPFRDELLQYAMND